VPEEMFSVRVFVQRRCRSGLLVIGQEDGAK